MAVRLAVGLCLATSQTMAQDARRFEGEIGHVRNNAEQVRNFYSDLDGSIGENGHYFTPDLPAAKKWTDELAVRYEQVAKLFEAEKEREARAALSEADALRNRLHRWRDRLDRRVRQHESAPTEQWFNDNRRWLFTGGEPLLIAYAEARKAASEAWGRYAEATTPDISVADLQVAQDAAANASFDAWVAETKLVFHREFHEITANRTVSPEVDAQLKALELTVAEQIESTRQREAAERRVRMLEQQRRSQQDVLRKTFTDAMRAKREADEAKRRAEEEARQKARQAK